MQVTTYHAPDYWGCVSHIISQHTLSDLCFGVCKVQHSGSSPSGSDSPFLQGAVQLKLILNQMNTYHLA